MRMLILHLTVGLLCGFLGYQLGRPAAGSPAMPTRASVPDSGSPLYRPAPAWKKQIDHVRKAPASRSETAWVKWAFAVPDTEIPSAIASLNPLADFHALRVLFSRWMRLDPAAALLSFDALPIPLQLQSWYQSEKGKRLTLVNSTLQNTPRLLILGRMLCSWSRDDPAAASAYAEKFKTSFTREHSDKASELGMYFVDVFLRSADSPTSVKSPAGKPAEIFATALGMPEKNQRGTALRESLRKWALTDPAAAASAFLAMPESDRQSMGGQPDKIFRTSPPEIRSQVFSAGLTDVKISQENLNTYFKSPGGDAGWTYSSEVTRELSQSSAALAEWTQADPAAARAWLTGQPDSKVKSFLTGELAGALSRTSPQQAVALLAGLPDADLPAAVASLTAGWAQTDIAGCAEWVSKIDDSATRDSARQMLARSIMASDPAYALRLSTGITDPAARTEIQRSITSGLSWNPAGLEAIIAADPQLKAALRPDAP